MGREYLELVDREMEKFSEAYMQGLSPKLKEWLERYNFRMGRWLAKGNIGTVESVREGFAILTRTLLKNIPDIALIQDGMVIASHSIPVRVYHPQPDRSLPVLVYLHGGGHMAGSINVYDPICRKIALATDHIVVGVEYRLAPENPYPAGIEDALVVVRTYRDLLNRMELQFLPKLTVAGDSAGGAMAATIAHRCQQDKKVQIRYLILIYPGLDYTSCLPSFDDFGRGYFLEAERIHFYFDNYFSEDDNRKDASPLYMNIHPDFPKTLIITAGFCPLRDEGIRYCTLLKDGGIPVQHLHCSDMIHTFLNLESLVPDNCRQVYATMGRFLNPVNNDR